jgi:predicted dehydrogenase
MPLRVGMNRHVRFAVVGAGHIAQVAVLPAFRNAPEAELTALVSGDEVKLRELGERYQVRHRVRYDGYDELLAADVVDAVYIALPNHLHCDYAVRAARAGKHVLCEKPMAVTEAECRQMIAACESAGVKLMVAYRLHFEAANLGAIEHALDGELGELRTFTSTFSLEVEEGDIRLNPIARGGGSVYDLGIYCINAARGLFRAEPEEVFAMSERGRDPRFREADEMTAAVLRFPGGRVATFVCSFGAARTSSYRLIGTKGQLVMEPAYEYAAELEYELHFGDEVRRERFGRRDQFGPELAYFARCVLSGQDPEPGGWEGLCDVRVIEAIYRSAATGELVRVPGGIEPERPTPDQEIHRPPVEQPRPVHT